MTPDELKQIRLDLGLTLFGMAKEIGVGQARVPSPTKQQRGAAEKHVLRLEQGKIQCRGSVRRIYELLRDGRLMPGA